jgi:hypothetical protein
VFNKDILVNVHRILMLANTREVCFSALRITVKITSVMHSFTVRVQANTVKF